MMQQNAEKKGKQIAQQKCNAYTALEERAAQMQTKQPSDILQVLNTL